MFTKSFISAALVSVFALSGTAYAETVYLGGPKAMFTTRATTQAVQTKKPYAQYVPGTRARGNAPVYQSGPKSRILHGPPQR